MCTMGDQMNTLRETTENMAGIVKPKISTKQLSNCTWACDGVFLSLHVLFET